MERPTLSSSYAVKQAGDTIHQYLHQAIQSIDDAFGKGYAKEHPEMLGQLVMAQVNDFNCCASVAASYAMSDALDRVADAIRDKTDDVIATIINNKDADGLF